MRLSSLFLLLGVPAVFATLNLDQALSPNIASSSGRLSQPTNTNPTQKSSSSPQKPDIFARLEAIQKFSFLAKRITALSEDPNISPFQRFQQIISDHDVASTVQYIFANAGTALTPEVLNAIKSFVKSSPLVPDEYRSLAVGVAESLGTVFHPDFAGHFLAAKGVLDTLGDDLIPALEGVWRVISWVLDTFAGRLQALIQRVALWRRAMTSPEMMEMLDMLTKQDTLDSIADSVGRMKDALTAERVHQLNVLFKEHGVVDLDHDQYETFGDTLGSRLKEQLTTKEGIAQVERFVNFLDGLQAQAISDVLQILHLRASVAPGISDNFKTLVDNQDNAKEIIPVVADTLRSILRLSELLQGTKSPETPLQVWNEVTLISAKLSSLPPDTMTALHHYIQALARIFQPDHVLELEILVIDVLCVYRVNGLYANNTSAVVMFDGWGMLDMTPAKPPAPDKAARLLTDLAAALSTDGIEATGKAVRMVAKSGSFLLEIIQTFQED